jgi:hypothetical protein
VILPVARTDVSGSLLLFAAATSDKNIGPKQSSDPNRNAGRNRRNHSQSRSTDEF